jgi:hypothetical protein
MLCRRVGVLPMGLDRDGALPGQGRAHARYASGNRGRSQR